MVEPPPDTDAVRVRIPNSPTAPQRTNTMMNARANRRAVRARRSLPAGMGCGAVEGSSLTPLRGLVLRPALQDVANQVPAPVDHSGGRSGGDVGRRFVGRPRVWASRRRLLGPAHLLAEVAEVGGRERLSYLREHLSLLLLGVVQHVLLQHLHLGAEP